jgi:hypothetical protein
VKRRQKESSSHPQQSHLQVKDDNGDLARERIPRISTRRVQKALLSVFMLGIMRAFGVVVCLVQDNDEHGGKAQGNV